MYSRFVLPRRRGRRRRRGGGRDWTEIAAREAVKRNIPLEQLYEMLRRLAAAERYAKGG